MLLVPCPWCGPRDEVEFTYGGQAEIAYPTDPEALWHRHLAAGGTRHYLMAIANAKQRLPRIQQSTHSVEKGEDLGLVRSRITR